MSAASALDSIPTKSSSDMEWKAWYDILPFSTKDNNLLFAKAWKVRGGGKANTSDLRLYLKDKGLNLTSDNILGEIKDLDLTILDSIGSSFKTTSTVITVIGITGLVFTLALIWRIATPENVGAGLELAGKAAVVA